MTTDLKQDNNRTTFLTLVAAILFSTGFQVGFSKLPNISEVILAGAASSVFSTVLVMLTNLLPHDLKHKLIFTRLFNEMPACRIHKLILKDPRIDYELANEQWPDVFSNKADPGQRNSLWYQQIYKTVKDKPEVIQAHRNFLLYRDICSGMFMLLLIAAVWQYIGDPTLTGLLVPAVFYTLGGFTLLSLIAARFAGNRFVVNTVAAAM